MKLRMRTLSAGPKGVRRPGQIVDVPEAEGEQLLKGGYAERLDAPAPKKASTDTETATKAPPENANGKGGKPAKPDAKAD